MGELRYLVWPDSGSGKTLFSPNKNSHVARQILDLVKVVRPNKNLVVL